MKIDGKAAVPTKELEVPGKRIRSHNMSNGGSPARMAGNLCWASRTMPRKACMLGPRTTADLDEEAADALPGVLRSHNINGGVH